jgi:cytosine/adenosine deaminase-related metal-dependent hydrolase
MPGLSRRTFLQGAGAASAAAVLAIAGGQAAYQVRRWRSTRAERTRLVLTGRVVTFDRSQPLVDDGAVYVDERGVIAAIRPRAAPIIQDYAAAARIETDADIYPGLIDLHNHPYFDLRSLRTPDRAYRDRYELRADPKWTADAQAVELYWRFAKEEALKFVELKTIAAGVTTLQGGVGFDTAREGWLLRHVGREMRAGRPVAASHVFKPEGPDPLGVFRDTIAAGTALIYHLAEGTDPAVGREFDELEAAGCIGPRFIGIHATALNEDQLRRWGRKGGTLVWSPMSNLWLYGKTTDVAAARASGLRLCLGPDWSISGSKNLLLELKVADLWNRTRLGRVFTDRDLCEMATANAADALALDDRIGRLRAGLLADIVVMARRQDDPYRNLIEATEKQVLLVLADGHVRFGRADLLRAARAANLTPVAASATAAVSLPDPAIDTSVLTWREIVTTLDRVQWAQERLAVLPVPHATLPPLDSFTPDDAYFRSIESAPILGGALNGLRDYYR